MPPAAPATIPCVEAQPANLGDDSTRIIQFVNLYPAGVSPSDVAEALDLEVSKARVYLGRLVDSGRIARAKRGVYTPVTSVTSLLSAHPESNDITEATPLSGDHDTPHDAPEQTAPTCRDCDRGLITRDSIEAGICLTCAKAAEA